MSSLSLKEYQKHNFHAVILNPGYFRNIILASPPLYGQCDELEVLRLRNVTSTNVTSTLHLYNQTCLNSECFKGFLIYNRVERFD